MVRTPQSNAASRMLKTKIGDDKFNEKFLSDLKRSFNRKMQDLKSSDRKKNWFLVIVMQFTSFSLELLLDVEDMVLGVLQGLDELAALGCLSSQGGLH